MVISARASCKKRTFFQDEFCEAREVVGCGMQRDREGLTHDGFSVHSEEG